MSATYVFNAHLDRTHFPDPTTDIPQRVGIALLNRMPIFDDTPAIGDSYWGTTDSPIKSIDMLINNDHFQAIAVQAGINGGADKTFIANTPEQLEATINMENYYLIGGVSPTQKWYAVPGQSSNGKGFKVPHHIGIVQGMAIYYDGAIDGLLHPLIFMMRLHEPILVTGDANAPAFIGTGGDLFFGWNV